MSAGGSKGKGSPASKEGHPSPHPQEEGRHHSAEAGATFGRHRRSRSGTRNPTTTGAEGEAEDVEEPAGDMLEAEEAVEEEPAHKAISKQQGVHCIIDVHFSF